MRNNKGQTRSLLLGLVRYGQIETTQPRAKRLQGQIDRLIVRAKKGNLAARRQVLKALSDEQMTNRLVDEITPRLGKRESGFTRIIKIGERKGDRAMMVKIEFVEASTPVVTTPVEPAPKKTVLAKPQVEKKTSKRKVAKKIK